VLDPPVIPQRLALILGTRLLAADEVTHLLTRLTTDDPLALTHADRRQPGPSLSIAESFGVLEDGLTAILLPAVTAFPRLRGVVLQASEVMVKRPGDRLLDVIRQMLLVVLDRRHVVAALVKDLLGDGLLAAQGVDGHQGAVQIEESEQAGDGRDLVG